MDPRVLNRSRPSRATRHPRRGTPPTQAVGRPPRKTPGQRPDLNKCTLQGAAALSELAQVLSTWASYERRAEEWRFEKGLAQEDVRIGEQQVKMAEDGLRITGQERIIADTQARHAQDTVEFLKTKFTNVELHDWMSRVLGTVYAYFLQQATATARLAASQLAFERQEPPPPFIQADYWQAPAESSGFSGGDATGPDRRGLTGAERLLQDIYQLDQFAFDTNRRKQQLTTTISLARLAPVEFKRFQQMGVMTVATPMELFERQFPGQFLRLVRRASISLVALVPPEAGINATLTSSRLSRVVIGGDFFQTVPIQRGPDQIAITSPRPNAAEPDPQPEMLAPHEGIGVDTVWEFRMLKAANPNVNYSAIADIHLRIDFTALNSFDYAQQVIQRLKPTISAVQPFSFRNQGFQAKEVWLACSTCRAFVDAGDREELVDRAWHRLMHAGWTSDRPSRAQLRDQLDQLFWTPRSA